MEFKRKIYLKLLEWKNDCKGEKALLVEGARRIGKSTICEAFGKNEYKSYLLIDFNTASPTVKEAFQRYMNQLDTLFMILSTEYKVTLHRRESLIIFDEVQNFPEARQAIKYLVKDGRYDYLETGSLISIRKNVHGITVPSEERKIKMYPMDFEEFCWALGEEQIIEFIRHCFENLLPLEEGLHKKAMLLFMQYILVGGMPKPIDRYLFSDRNFDECDQEKRDILSLYRDDISKIDGTYRAHVLSVFDQIPSFLSHHEKRVRLSSVQGGSGFFSFEKTFFWLADSMITNQCFNCCDPNVGLSLNEERTFVKCYMGDTGLLVSHAFRETEIHKNELYKQILHGKLAINEGMLFENVISQMLISQGHELYFYNHYNAESKRNDMEVDFLLTNQSKTNFRLYPLEVKSTGRYTLTSLELFLKKYRKRIDKAYVLHTRNLMVNGDIICLPAYMAFCL